MRFLASANIVASGAASMVLIASLGAPHVINWMSIADALQAGDPAASSRMLQGEVAYWHHRATVSMYACLGLLAWTGVNPIWLGSRRRRRRRLR